MFRYKLFAVKLKTLWLPCGCIINTRLIIIKIIHTYLVHLLSSNEQASVLHTLLKKYLLFITYRKNFFTKKANKTTGDFFVQVHFIFNFFVKTNSKDI